MHCGMDYEIDGIRGGQNDEWMDGMRGGYIEEWMVEMDGWNKMDGMRWME